MSAIGQPTPPDGAPGPPGPPVPSLTLVVLLLVPCVVILLLLNCLFLGYKLSKKNRKPRGDPEEVLLRSTLQRVRRASPPQRDGGRGYVSVSHPVTSSRASSREGAGLDHRFRPPRPDGATGSGSLRGAPSTIRAISSGAGLSPGLDLPSDSSACSRTRVIPVPPNSPAVTLLLSPSSLTTNTLNSSSQHASGYVVRVRRGSKYETTEEIPAVPVYIFDKVAMETEYISPSLEASHLNASHLNASAVGPGLDSDFGASAGVSLRILSADSDGSSSGVLASALEWDYYDPCYVKQNNVPKHKHHRPAVHTKQYWV
ncbi:protein huluwa [Brachionichthys hirsutus]|uniref:protein huluwa n=1 Tax=Brachionichthys hirsutus TaxID=412623 RepID=UPI0036053A4D